MIDELYLWPGQEFDGLRYTFYPSCTLVADCGVPTWSFSAST